MTKKVRFEVLKRDGFRCVYCGRVPPEVVLQVDHVVPRASGGTDDMENLVAACFDCNSGKRARPVAEVPDKFRKRIEVLSDVLKSKMDNAVAAVESFKAIERIRNETLVFFHDKWNEIVDFDEEYSSLDDLRDVDNSVWKLFKRGIGVDFFVEAMTITRRRFEGRAVPIYSKFRYFCGVCWKKIREMEGEK